MFGDAWLDLISLIGFGGMFVIGWKISEALTKEKK